MISGPARDVLFSECKFATEGGAINHIAPLFLAEAVQFALQVAGVVELLGLVQSGPNPDLASGTLSIAKGPALCWPLNGVVLAGSK